MIRRSQIDRHRNAWRTDHRRQARDTAEEPKLKPVITNRLTTIVAYDS